MNKFWSNCINFKANELHNLKVIKSSFENQIRIEIKQL